MAGICCGVVGESESAAPVEPSSRAARRRRMELRAPFKFISPPLDNGVRRRKFEMVLPRSQGCENTVASCEHKSAMGENKVVVSSNLRAQNDAVQDVPSFGMTSVCGRRWDMEDAVSIHPLFCEEESAADSNGIHFFGVFDGHGCSHVAMRCKERFHEIVKEEVERKRNSSPAVEWKEAMEQSFERMDAEVSEWCTGSTPAATTTTCRCELQTPQCDAVGSTAVVAIVTPDKIVVSNCGDSRAVLCRNGVAVPLSSDHKPDRPDELLRINQAGGRVIYWDGPRVLGVLAMSRAIGDNYLKPYVTSKPEVTVIDRTDEDECLILASDGLWDVVSNDTACGVARICLRSQGASSPPSPPETVNSGDAGESSNRACSDASILLTKLALARHSTDNVSVLVVDLRRNRRE